MKTRSTSQGSKSFLRNGCVWRPKVRVDPLCATAVNKYWKWWLIHYGLNNHSGDKLQLSPCRLGELRYSLWLASSHVRAGNWTSTSCISFLPLKHPVFIYLLLQSWCQLTHVTWQMHLTETLCQCPQEGRQKGTSGLELQYARCSEKSSGWKLKSSCEVRKKRESLYSVGGKKETHLINTNSRHI